MFLRYAFVCISKQLGNLFGILCVFACMHVCVSLRVWMSPLGYTALHVCTVMSVKLKG